MTQLTYQYITCTKHMKYIKAAIGKKLHLFIKQKMFMTGPLVFDAFIPPKNQTAGSIGVH